MKTKSTTAATAAASKATTIKVKPLVWTGTVSHSSIVAETSIGNYCISIGDASSLSKPFELCDPWDRIKYFSSIEDAKQAALVWYNETIVECLAKE